MLLWNPEQIDHGLQVDAGIIVSISYKTNAWSVKLLNNEDSWTLHAFS